MSAQNFDVVVSGVPYNVHVVPFEFNGEKRFKIAYNGGVEHIFTWDSSIGRLTAIDDDSVSIPDEAEQAIASVLQSGRF